ncbi:hypothetical protein [Sphingomonas sp.]|jgi:type IV secretory pathway VirB10-like protein|uniref:hypothetical protein n=1 Tax=Sphingomonas sp. TaxID=28214 RepID=UPI002DF4EFBF|nr:hypothetical protein [Sphingomonas sp.]
MPRAAKLKVYRTPIGFHDAYVAAPSQKAALKAWGADANLFARGVAEQVDDPELVKEPLARPGEVIRKLRGGLEDHLKALPTDPKQPKPASKPKAKAPPPSRAKLQAAEQALADAQASQAEQLAEMKRREEALAKERRALEDRHATEQARLEQALDKERQAYDRAVARWQG